MRFFFLDLPQVDLENIIGVVYNSLYQTRKITTYKVQVAIVGFISKKAPKIDQIPNFILTLLIKQLFFYLYPTFNNILSFTYCIFYF